MTHFKKTWRINPNGPLLGTVDIISPWTGSETEAVVNIDTNEVIAAHGATCHPFQLAVPAEIFKGELREVIDMLPAPALQISDLSESGNV